MPKKGGKKRTGWGAGQDPREAEEMQAQAVRRQAEADDAMFGEWSSGGAGGAGAAGAAGGGGLARQRSRRGPAYDELLDKGIPHHMLRRAWVVADGDPEGAMDFVRANFDQPGAFWDADAEGDPKHLGSPPCAGSGGSDVDEGTPLRRVLSAGSEPRRSGARLAWHTQPQHHSQYSQPVPEPVPEEHSGVPSGMLVEQPLHDLLAQARDTLAAAAKAWADGPSALAEPQKAGEEDITGQAHTSPALRSPELVQAERDLESLEKHYFDEVMAIKNPPHGLIVTARCVAAILHAEGALPEEFSVLQPGTAESQEWRRLQRLLLERSFRTILLECTANLLLRGETTRSKYLEEYANTYTQDPSFVPEALGKVSRLAECLCAWCLAVLNLNSAHSTQEDEAAVACGSASRAALARVGKKCADEEAQFVRHVRTGEVRLTSTCSLATHCRIQI